MTKAQIIEKAVASVRRAKSYCPDIEFSPEDAARTEIDFLCEVVEAAIEAGATTVNIPDTVGYATPLQYATVIRTLKERVPNIERAIISTHCHDDLGLAVANSLAGCEAGARQVECTINGIGERAGNAALEEVVMALKTRFDYYGLTTGIKTERLYPASRMLSTITGLAVQRNKAIVGRNAFAHEAGIHQDGMLKERSTYEIMRPEDVGVPRTDLVLGKHSGRHALRERVAEMGYTLTDEQLETLFNDFKALADKKKEVYDEDLVVLIEKHLERRAGALAAGQPAHDGRAVGPADGHGRDPPARRRDRPGRRHRRRPGRRDLQGGRAGHGRARQPARVRRPERDRRARTRRAR